MGLFSRETPVQKEWRRLQEQERRFLQKRMEKKDSLLGRKLEELVPPQLQTTLDAAFAKAFALVFDKGTGLLEKTYPREKLEQERQVRQYAWELKQDAKSLRSFAQTARNAGRKNLLLSGASGVGMGALGIGLPDIPIFTGMLLKTIYEIALHFGFGYESLEERYFILLLIQGAVSYGQRLIETDKELNRFIENGSLPSGYEEEKQIASTTGALSKELLYLKFLQGIPVVGAVGGAYDAVYLQKVTEYAGLKYRRRFLREWESRQ